MIRPGIHPFWFWNTAMDAARIDAQLRALAAGGCRGAFISARQGYPDGYLSARWLELVAHACEAGAALGLEIGVADEFPYPSGNAGGLVTLGHPERWATDLVQVARETGGGPLAWQLPAGAVLDCAAFPRRGGAVAWAERRDLAGAVGVAFRQETYRESDRDLSAYNGRRYFACDPAPRLETVLPAGDWLVIASLQTTGLHYKYVGPTVDTLDPEAMAAFLAATHRRYQGIPLRSLFVDEIAPGRWSRHLPGWYRERHGADLLPLLPALLRDDHPRATELRAALAAIRQERFAAAFLVPLRAWGRAHGVAVCEERPLERLADAGADIPGCDPGHTRVGAERHDLLGRDPRRNARSAAAAGRGIALCECGHSLGWGATLEDLRAICDGLLLHGITHIVPHAAFASTAALRKHDAPPSFFIQQAWWGLHHHLAARVEAILAALAGTAAVPELAVPPGTAEAVQHELMARGYEWTCADDAPAPDLAALPPPRLAPWSSQPLVHRCVRSGGGASVALLINQARTTAEVRLPPGWEPLPLDGAAPERNGEAWLLEPAQAMLVRLGAPPPPSLFHCEPRWPTRWRVHAAVGNLLRLGRWELAVAGGCATTTHFPLSEQLRRTGLALAPAIDPGFGTPTTLALPRLVCTYRAGFLREHPMPLRLVMEPETCVDPGWSVQVNDGPLLGAADFAPGDVLPGESLVADITPWLREGANTITVVTTTARPDGGLRNPLYLHGDFAALPGGRLAAPRTEAPFGDLAAAGLPWACGTVEWEADLELPPAVAGTDGRAALRLPRLAVDAYEVALDEGAWTAVPWAPRRALLPAWTAGRHRLRVRQHLPPGRCFHGEGWDAERHAVTAIPA